MGEDFSNILPKSGYKDFFEDLYSEAYVDEIMHMPFKVEYNGGILRLKDSQSKYYTVTNGERMTVDQPNKFDRSIYFLGPCYIYGHYVEDRNTIASIVQKYLCEKGSIARCVNYGAVGMSYGYNCLPCIAAIPLRKGDIVVIDRPPYGIEGVKYLEISSILEKYDVNIAWMVEHPMHCNHKMNKVYADAIYEEIEPILTEKTQGHGELVEKDENYIKLLYLQRYFTGCNFQQFHRIGSIVMNCNPFTYGHRYLIEQALKSVDFLIIFVVEEDKSCFSYIERFSMIKEGVADLENVMVVPSGPFILSQMSFPEYFIKETSEDLNKHTEQDIMTFVEKIAPQLGIQCRFVGEEPEDEVTEQYNMAMKKILPQYGMDLIEIPRKMVNEKPISASLVRECIEKGNIDQLAELVPVSTRAFLGMA
ncbi:MAG: adenylyltransferase/cytidyltransferase family protein [Lachnospiraceae bacterium]|nr:adenylyltransferase/cytidyltransferase family protein [Lachnospiraceae bacterium]